MDNSFLCNILLLSAVLENAVFMRDLDGILCLFSDENISRIQNA